MKQKNHIYVTGSCSCLVTADALRWVQKDDRAMCLAVLVAGYTCASSGCRRTA